MRGPIDFLRFRFGADYAAARLLPQFKNGSASRKSIVRDFGCALCTFGAVGTVPPRIARTLPQKQPPLGA